MIYIKKQGIASLVISLFMLSSACTKCKKSYTPVMPYFAYPDKEEFSVGDTIWLEARMPFLLKDFENGEITNYKNVDFKSYFYIGVYRDSSKYITEQPKPYIDPSNFTIFPVTGKYYNASGAFKIDYLSRNDTFFFKAGIVLKDTGFYSINLAYNPGSTAHGLQKIDVDGDNCKHTIGYLCQSFNNGKSTLYRAKKHGFKPWYSPAATKLEYWVYDNRDYYFYVKK